MNKDLQDGCFENSGAMGEKHPVPISFLYKFSLNEDTSIKEPPNRGRNPIFPLGYSWVLVRLMKVTDPQKTGMSYL